MVPASMDNFLEAACAAAGALIGLLFVAISLRPDATFGQQSSHLGRSLAGGAYTCLVNAFFLSLLALVPQLSLGTSAVVMGVVALADTARVHLSLGHTQINLLYVVVGCIPFVAQVVVGGFLIGQPTSTGLAALIALLIIVSFALALARAWTLLQGRHVPIADETHDAATH